MVREILFLLEFQFNKKIFVQVTYTHLSHTKRRTLQIKGFWYFKTNILKKRKGNQIWKRKDALKRRTARSFLICSCFLLKSFIKPKKNFKRSKKDNNTFMKILLFFILY